MGTHVKYSWTETSSPEVVSVNMKEGVIYSTFEGDVLSTQMKQRLGVQTGRFYFYAEVCLKTVLISVPIPFINLRLNAVENTLDGQKGSCLSGSPSTYLQTWRWIHRNSLALQ